MPSAIRQSVAWRISPVKSTSFNLNLSNEIYQWSGSCGSAYHLPLDEAMKNILKCYVSGKLLANEKNQGIISFAVPEYGVLFRCNTAGSHADLEIIAFLSFLRFTEHNKNLFTKKELHVFSDFPPLVYLMNKGIVNGNGMEVVLRQAEKFTKGLSYKVKWIDEQQNRAGRSIREIPDMPSNSTVVIKSFVNLSIQKHINDPADGMKL